MIDSLVPRQLSFSHDREIVTIAADGALTDPRLVGRPLIVLGEAGSGKSELLRFWADGSVATARQLINGWQASQGQSFVDGLDEAAGLQDGDALDQVLGALQAQRNTDFVLACRVADWRSASSVETIKNWTGIGPVELTIEPLGCEEIVAFLCTRAKVDGAEAKEFVDYYERRGFAEWLGNPQTLTMLAGGARAKTRPEATGDLFAQFVDRCWQEHRKQHGGQAVASKAEVLDALGALFAALIIGGYDAITLAPGAEQLVGDLPLAECGKLPGILGLSDDNLKKFLNSRLVAGLIPDRYTYKHRRIGEYLAARWLATRVTTRELQTRVLGALRHGAVVPSNLRGLWGWLAAYETLAAEVIAIDPLAVIDYGNADTLSPTASKALLGAIECAEDRQEDFGWRDYHAASLIQAELASEVERVFAVSGETRFWTQTILLRQMRDAAVVQRYATTLHALMLDEARAYAIRDAAADALADHGELINWPAIITQLVGGQKRDSLRLALVMMLNANVGLTLSDVAFADTVYAYSGLTPRFSATHEVGTVSLYHLGRRQAIGDERLEGLLDALADCANRYLDDQRDTKAWDVQRLFYALLERRLLLGFVNPETLWRWLSASGYDDYGSTREPRERVDEWLQVNGSVRQALQLKVLDACVEKPRLFNLRLREVAAGLLPTTDDVIALLDLIPEGDPRWRELIWLAPRRECGEGARQAAARHVHTEEDSQLLRDHADPPSPEWELKDAAGKARHEADRLARHAEHRANYLAAQVRMRSGDYGAIVGPAEIYMGRAHEGERNALPERRVADWIGDDLQAEAFTGFEAFLTAEPPRPTATEIAETHARSRSWPAALIIVAALNERLRSGRGFGKLADERLQAGLLEIVGGLVDGQEWKPLHAALTDELTRRGAWEPYARLLIEPQLNRRANYPTGLWEVLAAPAGPALAADWLRAFPRMAAEPEEALIDHLLRDGSAASREALMEVARRRRRVKTLDERRQHNWQALELILGVAMPAHVATLAAADRAFLWVMRNRMGRRRRAGTTTIVPSPALLAAIVVAFAPLYPSTSMPSGGSIGDVNPWDATDFLVGCLDTLAADPSAAATKALTTVARIDSSYNWKIGRSVADQQRAYANAEWRPHPVNELAKLVIDGPPIDHADLQRVLLAELDVVQAKIKSGDADVRDLFYQARTPKFEELCSDVLVTLLRQTERPLTFTLEAHLGGNREGDIWCESGTLAVAVECKRHWHAHLWTAFDWQLAQQQAIDWRARGHGIYVVYWFGADVHSVTGPPRGSGIAKPTTPEALEAALRARIAEAGLPDIAVKVLDVSRSDA